MKDIIEPAGVDHYTQHTETCRVPMPYCYYIYQKKGKKEAKLSFQVVIVKTANI